MTECVEHEFSATIVWWIGCIRVSSVLLLRNIWVGFQLEYATALYSSVAVKYSFAIVLYSSATCVVLF